MPNTKTDNGSTIPSNSPVSFRSDIDSDQGTSLEADGITKIIHFKCNDLVVKFESKLSSEDIESGGDKPKLKQPLDVVDSLIFKTDVRYIKLFVGPMWY